jgi:hypothetical protein
MAEYAPGPDRFPAQNPATIKLTHYPISTRTNGETLCQLTEDGAAVYDLFRRQPKCFQAKRGRRAKETKLPPPIDFVAAFPE